MAKFPRMASLYDQTILPLAGNGGKPVRGFSQFFSNHNQYLPQYGGQSSINQQSSIRSKNFSTFPRKFLVCDQPWVK